MQELPIPPTYARLRRRVLVARDWSNPTKTLLNPVHHVPRLSKGASCGTNQICYLTNSSPTTVCCIQLPFDILSNYNSEEENRFSSLCHRSTKTQNHAKHTHTHSSRLTHHVHAIPIQRRLQRTRTRSNKPRQSRQRQPNNQHINSLSSNT